MTELLAPLTSAADLPNHPSLSIHYTSTTLSDMVQQACEMVHRERKTLWSFKHLLTKLRGDDTWIPCGALDDIEVDLTIFGTENLFDFDEIAANGGKKLDSELTAGNGKASTHAQNGPAFDSESAFARDVDDTSPIMTQKEYDAIAPIAHGDIRMDEHPDWGVTETDEDEILDKTPTTAEINAAVISELKNAINTIYKDDTSMSGPQDKDLTAGEETPSITKDAGKASDINQATASEVSQQEQTASLANSEAQLPATEANKPTATKDTTEDQAIVNHSPPDPNIVSKATATADDNKNTATSDCPTKLDDPKDVIPTRSASLSSTSHPPPHRMLTRAQAAASTPSAHDTPAPRPPSPPPFIHPLYLPPASAPPSRDLGLPDSEAEETRRILMLWVQKQEEVVRGAEKLYEGLLKADRMRKTVWGWCKAEGHVGEMSDGEDWYDVEEWGLEGGLRKGNLEEEEDVGETRGGKKGRRGRGI